MKIKITTLLFVLLLANNPNALAEDSLIKHNLFFLKINPVFPFTFLGKIDTSKASAASGPILYPGDNALVFFTAILTHAAIQGGVENSVKSKAQLEANKVLFDYQPIIDSYNSLPNAVPKNLPIVVSGEQQDVNFYTDETLADQTNWQMDIAPVFFVTQNHGSIILYNRIVLLENSLLAGKTIKPKSHKTAQKKNAVNPNEKIVVVISDPIQNSDYKNYWIENAGIRFTETLNEMYKKSLTLAINSKLNKEHNENAEQVTVRYFEDGVKKIERGIIIAADCKRTLFETLLGEIKYVPNIDYFNCPIS